jgi:hypothetical protein
MLVMSDGRLEGSVSRDQLLQFLVTRADLKM